MHGKAGLGLKPDFKHLGKWDMTLDCTHFQRYEFCKPIGQKILNNQVLVLVLIYHTRT